MRDPEHDNLDYLNDILERLQRIRSFAQEGKTAFLESVMMQDAIIRNFEVMGEATKRLTTDLRQQYPQVAWRKIAGFRDVLIHNYGENRIHHHSLTPDPIGVSAACPQNLLKESAANWPNNGLPIS
jgi:uncharacterized protein with HEPN domain